MTGRIILCLALLVGAALRFWDLGLHSMWIDEVTTLQAIGTFKQAASQSFHPPMHYVLLWAWSSVFGTSPAALRALSALAGTVAIWLAYRLGRELWGRDEPAAMGALVTALLPFHVHFAREARMYSLWLAFMLLAAWGAARLAGAQRLHARDAAMYLGGLLAAQATHYYTVFYAAPAAVFTMVLLGKHWLRKGWPELRNWLLLHGAAIIGALAVSIRLVYKHGSPTAALAYVQRVAAKGEWTISWKGTGHILWFRDYAHRNWAEEYATHGKWGVAMCCAAVMLMWTDRAAHRKRVLLLAVLLFLPVVAIDLLPIRDYSRLLTPTAGFAALAIGYLLWSPARVVPGWGWLATICTTVALAWSMRTNAVAVFTEEIEPWKTVCPYIHEREQPGDLIFVTASHMTPAFKYCYRGPNKVFRFRRSRKVLDKSKKARRVWLIYTHLYSSDRADVRRRAVKDLRRSFRLIGTLNAGPILQVYELERDPKKKPKKKKKRTKERREKKGNEKKP